MKKTIVLVLVLALRLTANVTMADFTFGEPTNLGPSINSPAHDYDPSMSADELERYLVSERPGGYGGRDLWVATRASVSDPWAQSVNLGPTVNTAYDDCCPDISADGLSLFFWSRRPGGSGGEDLWVTTRTTRSEPWGIPVNLGPTVNSSAWDGGPSLSADGLSLLFFSGRPGGSGGWDIWITTRGTISDPWGEPVNLGPTVNSPADDATPDISADRLALFFFSTRSGGYGDYDLWLTTRTTHSNPWGPPVNLGPTVNNSTSDFSPNILADGSTLFFSSGQPGGLGGEDIWQVSISPVVDFNGDGKADGREVLIMAECWGTNDSVCDIGPMPWGDGTVDVEDLKVLAKYVGEPGVDPTLMGHWAMDEMEGIVVHDLAGGNNGTIFGLPQWRPQGGRTDGALELNGTTFIAAESARSPADGPFSVLAWIKGGAPGQTIISQGGAANWLTADVATGALMTELLKGGRTGGGLSSQVIITDGNWHRIAFTWDGGHRRLYVDGTLVAEDAQDSLAPSSGSSNVIMGAAKNMAPGTFWTGLIDDVRIYNRAVKP